MWLHAHGNFLEYPKNWNRWDNFTWLIVRNYVEALLQGEVRQGRGLWQMQSYQHATRGALCSHECTCKYTDLVYLSGRHFNSLWPSDAYMRRWFGSSLVQIMACRLNQCWNIVDWAFRNKLPWNLNRNPNIFIQEIAFENVVCKIASILSRPQWVKATNRG